MHKKNTQPKEEQNVVLFFLNGASNHDVKYNQQD